jgi:hypothetical protein
MAEQKRAWELDMEFLDHQAEVEEEQQFYRDAFRAGFSAREIYGPGGAPRP